MIKEGSSNLFSGTDGHSLLFCLSLLLLFFSFSCSFSRALASRMTCCAGVRGSFVGVSLFLAADHQLLPSFCEEGDGGVAGIV